MSALSNFKIRLNAALVLALFLALPDARSHEWHGSTVPPPGPEREALRAHLLQEWQAYEQAEHGPDRNKPHPPPVAPVNVATSAMDFASLQALLASVSVGVEAGVPWQAAPFQKFTKLQLRWDSHYLYIGSNGLPDHPMMIGITNWQQQVPLPQSYFGDNAWRLPLHPVPAKEQIFIKNRFLRGAIAIAVNGIPIFNPQNNRGEVSQEIGELDRWGGHCGRADDYHYHAAPLHLEAVVGKGMPIAYALDGYPIYGLTEPDGSPPTGLDAYHGHETKALGYHYHASTKYPYVNGGFHGEVTEVENQVDPQPRANSVRPATGPLPGAKIVGFEAASDYRSQSLKYTVNGRPGAIHFSQLSNGAWKFQFVSTNGQTEEQTYTGERRGGGQGGQGRPPRPGNRPGPGQSIPGGNPSPPPGQNPPPPPAPIGHDSGTPATKNGAFVLTSPDLTEGGEMPAEYTGEGAGITPPLVWKGAPPGTLSYALVMHHLDPEGKTKWYWIVYNLPASLQSLPKNVQGVGTVGTGFKGRVGYEPPHSKGPGAKTYVLSLYALSGPPAVNVSPEQVTYGVIMRAMEGKILASADLSVVHTSKGESGRSEPPGGPDRPRRNPGNGPPPPP